MREDLHRETRLWIGAGVPRRHQKFVVPTTAQQVAHEKIIARFSDGFIIPVIGPRGTGKTQLAVAVIRYACWRGLPSRYWKALDVFAASRDSMSDPRGEQRLLRQFTRCPLLVIDESHVRAHSNYEHRTLTHIIDKRYDAMLSTLLISNETKEAALGHLGPSIADRIRECGGFIELNGSTMRGRECT